jgi:hypothetical protein
VAGYLAPFLSQLDQRHSAPLKLSQSLSPALGSISLPMPGKRRFQNLWNAPELSNHKPERIYDKEPIAKVKD